MNQLQYDQIKQAAYQDEINKLAKHYDKESAAEDKAEGYKEEGPGESMPGKKKSKKDFFKKFEKKATLEQIKETAFHDELNKIASISPAGMAAGTINQFIPKATRAIGIGAGKPFANMPKLNMAALNKFRSGAKATRPNIQIKEASFQDEIQKIALSGKTYEKASEEAKRIVLEHIAKNNPVNPTTWTNKIDKKLLQINKFHLASKGIKTK